MFAQIGDTAVQEAVTDLFITISAIQGISSSEEALEAFSLIEGMSEESDELLGDELAEAIRALESQGYEVGCFFMNLDSGKGVSYNLDTRIYGASSFKGIYAAYLSEQFSRRRSGAFFFGNQSHECFGALLRQYCLFNAKKLLRWSRICRLD